MDLLFIEKVSHSSLHATSHLSSMQDYNYRMSMLFAPLFILVSLNMFSNSQQMTPIVVKRDKFFN